MTDNSSPNRSIARGQTVRELAKRLGKMEAGRRLAAGDVVTSTGIPALDTLLPDEGLRTGTLVEWLADSPASGVDLLALLSAKPLLRDGQALVLFDRQKAFHPTAAVAWGIPLRQTIVVRPKNQAEELWALEQCLQSAGVAVSYCRLEDVTSRILRRLQLAAERGNGLGCLLRPLSARGQPAWSDIRLAVTGVGSPSGLRCCRVELVRCRRGAGEKAVTLEIDNATGVVRETAELATTAHTSRAVRA